MAEAAVSFLLQDLRNLLDHEPDLPRNLVGKATQLKQDLYLMKCFLEDVEGKKTEGDVPVLISKIRELAFDAEDIVETFTLKVDDPIISRGLMWRLFFFRNHLNWLENQMDSIRSRFLGIPSISQTLATEGIDNDTSLVEIPNSVYEPRVVGLEDGIKILLREAVFNEKQGLSVATILGMGGIGKTTLAMAIFNHVVEQKHFDAIAWLCASQDFRPRGLLLGLLQQLSEHAQGKKILEIMENSTDLDLQHMVYKRLYGRRYFIVVDDLWNMEDWNYLKSVLPNEKYNGSRVLITSRSDTFDHGVDFVYKMQFLDSKESWEMLKKLSFNNEEVPLEIERVGMEIAEMCRGLPLAIKVAGHLLRGKFSLHEWVAVLENLNMPDDNRFSRILELSFSRLPPHLKSCFMFLCFFEVGTIISIKKFVQILIAEGVIAQNGEAEETMEEKARNYLNELIARSMVQVQDLSTDKSHCKSCRVHDLMHDLSITQAKGEIDLHISEINDGESVLPRKIRHCVIQKDGEMSLSSLSRHVHLRSLLLYEPKDIPSKFWKSFKLLRVVILEGLGLVMFPRTICQIVGLRYLGLRKNSLRKLPKSLGRLWRLQVLDVRENEGIEVPNVLWKMVSLRHLYFPCNVTVKNVLKLDTLKHLQTLYWIPMDKVIVDHLKQMANLSKLGIYSQNSGINNGLFTSLAGLGNLDSLKVRWVEGSPRDIGGLNSLVKLRKLSLDGRLREVPAAADFPPNLCWLTLCNSHLREGAGQSLRGLPFERIKLGPRAIS